MQQVIVGTRSSPPPGLIAGGIYARLVPAITPFYLRMSLGTVEVHRNGKVATLSPLAGRIVLALLVSAALTDAPVLGLADDLYADREDGGPDGIYVALRVHMLKARKALAPLGLGIVIAYGRGYRLVDVTPQPYPLLGKRRKGLTPWSPDQLYL